MRQVLRGEMYWSDLNPIRGQGVPQRRPVVVLSRDVYNERSGTVIVLPVTSQPQAAGFPLTLKNESVPLPKEAWIKISQIRTLPVDRLGARIGRLSPEALDTVLAGLNEILGKG